VKKEVGEMKNIGMHSSWFYVLAIKRSRYILDTQCGGSAITEPETVTMTVTETVTATATVTLSLTQHDIPPSVTELH
jgi:hypothetical protein